MAQQKMHCALGNNHIQKVSDKGHGHPSQKSLQQNSFKTSSETSEVSSLNWKDHDQRCAILTFLTVDSDGSWRIVLRCFDQQNQLGSGRVVNMNGLCFVSPPSINTIMAHQSKAHKGPQFDLPNAITSYTNRSLHGSNWKHQSQRKAFTNKAIRSNGLSGNSSCQSSITCSDSYDLIPKGFTAVASSDTFNGTSKVDKLLKKNSRKKKRKKGKQSKNVSSDRASTEPEILCGCAPGSSVSETCGCNYQGDGLISCASSTVVSLPAGYVNKFDVEGDTDGFNSSGSLKTCASNINDVDVSESALACIVQNIVVNSEISIQTDDQGFSVTDKGLEETYDLEEINNSGDMHFEGFSDIPNSLVLDSLSVGSNSKDISCGNDVKPFDKESIGVTFYEASGFSLTKGYLSHRNASSGVDIYNHTGCKQLGSQNFSSNEVPSLVPGKKGKQIRMLPRTSTVFRSGNAGNFHGWTGKENNHSVWQKVQRNGVDDCNCELKEVPVCSELDSTLKESPSLKRRCSIAKASISSRTETKKHAKDKVSKKLKKKTSLSSKQDYYCHNGRGSHPNKGSFRVKPSIQNEKTDTSAQVIGQKGVKSVSRSHSQNGSLRVELQAYRDECANLESVHSLHVLPDALQTLENTFESLPGKKNCCKEGEDSSLSMLCGLWDENLLEVQSPVYISDVLGNKDSQIGKEIAVTENKQNKSSGYIMQKWVPVGVKDSELITFTRSGNLSQDSEGPSGEDCTVRNSAEEKAAASVQDHISSLTVGVNQRSGNGNCFSCEDGNMQKLKNQLTSMLELYNKRDDTDCLTNESNNKKFAAFEAESRKIGEALNDACKAKVASEAVQITINGPIAEFERVLHFSSPIICQSASLSSCQICSQDQAISVSLCRHNTPNVPLGCIWQWYERHGSYGLEIKAEDYENPKRLGVDKFSFRAYFVPFLSSVQLFKNHESQPLGNSNVVPAPGILQTCEISETSENSKIVGLPIFSILVPKPRTTGAAQSVDMTCSNGVELLFEYFESEPPHYRRPLYEKIQDLVRGNEPSESKMYGDPTNLVSVNLKELHPRSWYSVAWYPIYRIPDGSFRAAFLTYHSLGHLVHRSDKSDSASRNGCLVSPVVGLESYNAEEECWFQLRQSGGRINGGGILKERLRSLEEMACVMARGVVKKGDEQCINRHPDYEFFVSRRKQ